jgi:hypothetical protein
MSKRKYDKCLWCGRTIDATNTSVGDDRARYEKELCGVKNEIAYL